MIKNIVACLTISLSGTAFSITKEDRKLADEYLSLPSTIQLIEVDPELTKLSPEEMYSKLEEEGVIRDIKWRKHVKNLMESHPDYDKLLETHPEPMEQLFPKFKYFDLENEQIIPGLPWEGANFGYDESIFQNQMPSFPGSASCIAKVRGNVGWFKAGPHTLSPWDAVIPLTDCVTFQKRYNRDPKKCYIAVCAPLSAQPGTIVVSELVRDIILGKWN